MKRVLVIHNYYRQRGGEDAVVESEADLLRSRGHEVELFSRHNDEIAGMLDAARETVWSRRSAEAVRERVQKFRPDVVHVHNTFPIISPSIYWVLEHAAVPVVQTLHNFRLLCPQAMLLRAGRVCEDCVGRLPWRAVPRACYRGSKLQSAGVAVMLAAHRALGTFQTKVSRFIALNDFCRRKFIQGGIPAGKIAIKPNFVGRPSVLGGRRGDEFLFVGRLSSEKGIATLAGAFRRLPDARLQVLGEGAEGNLLRSLSNVRLAGYASPTSVAAAMATASCLVLPSIWYENFPRTLVEAYASGLPVIASRLGALVDLVEDGVTGLLFEPGSEEDLSEKLRWARSHPEEMRRMGVRAHALYEERYTPEVNYAQLSEIYANVMREGA